MANIAGGGGGYQPMGPAQSMMAAAAQAFPTLTPYMPSVATKYSPGRGGNNYDEFYPPGESFSFAPKHPALEFFGHIGPAGVAGELTSHYLRFIDPHIRQTYNQFVQSLTPGQQNLLHQQYRWAQTHEGEKRPFADWKEVSGLPAMFRAYPFHQWPHAEKYFTSPQKLLLNALVTYLRTGRTR